MKVIILLGSPGAGKGTQAELLAKKLGLYYLETSKILERAFLKAKRGEFVGVEGKKYELQKERRLWEDGFLCSPPFVTYLIQGKIKRLHKFGESLVLAGSPRTLYEGKRIVPLLKKLYGLEHINVILIETTVQETLFRNSHRRICELMRHSILYTKETAKLTACPLDGSKLIRRKKLDDPETIKVRQKEYQERTLPLIDYFRERGLKVERINGSPSPAKVFKDILKTLEIDVGQDDSN